MVICVDKVIYGAGGSCAAGTGARFTPCPRPLVQSTTLRPKYIMTLNGVIFLKNAQKQTIIILQVYQTFCW